MTLKPGSRWRSAVCDTEVVVVRAVSTPAQLECGGRSMAPHATAPQTSGEVSAGHAAGSQMGKRYTDADSGLEVLCTRSGAGSLCLDGRPLVVKEAKKLPASD